MPKYNTAISTLLATLACGSASAITAYAGAFNGPAGVNGSEQTGVLSASASYFYDVGQQSMYAKAAAEAGSLHGFATASNSLGGYQFATSVAKSSESFLLSHPDGINEATIIWVLQLHGVCTATPGATNGRPNATCYAQLSLNPSTPWALSLDHEGEVITISTVQIVNGFGNNNYFPISPTLQVGGYATNGVFAADYENTGSVFVYSTTPGVSLITESGHNYSLPVPEPATWWLFVTPILLAGMHRFRVPHRRTSIVAIRRI